MFVRWHLAQQGSTNASRCSRKEKDPKLLLLEMAQSFKSMPNPLACSRFNGNYS